MKTYKDIATDGGSNVAGQVADQMARLSARLDSVRHIVAVMSGKGGVGKSSVAVNLAAALARDGQAVGILDADINGASIPKMAGVRNRPLEHGETGIIPPVNSLNMKIMSVNLLVEDDNEPVVWDAPTQHDAYTWRAMMEMGAIREFFSDTEWGTLDYLFVDLPPGTDKLPNIVGLLPRLSGTIVVTIPTGVSQMVVGKSIRIAKDLPKTPVLGIVENMASRICSHCGEEDVLFPGGQVESMAEEAGVPYLGSIPFDTRISVAADEEIPFMAEHHDTPAGRAIMRIADNIRAALSDNEKTGGIR